MQDFDKGGFTPPLSGNERSCKTSKTPERFDTSDTRMFHVKQHLSRCCKTLETSGTSDISGTSDKSTKIALICVGNKLLLDDGIGPAVYEELVSNYDFPVQVEIFDVGCMSLQMLSFVENFDLIITVDAVDGTEEPPGTVFRYRPEDVARRPGNKQSAHDLKLADLFDAAALLGTATEGLCLGMQVENREPAQVCIGLTPCCHERLHELVELVLAELTGRGVEVRVKATGEFVSPGYVHNVS